MPSKPGIMALDFGGPHNADELVPFCMRCLLPKPDVHRRQASCPDCTYLTQGAQSLT